MVTRIIYDTEFIDDGVSITPLSIAMRRDDGAELYAISDSLVAMARAAENAWLREHVLRWLPVEVTLTAGYGTIDAKVAWDEDHPEFENVKALEEIRDMVEDFVLAKPDPQLWAYYAAYDHVLYAQLFGPMAELPAGMPRYTMDLQHEAVIRGFDGELPQLPEELVRTNYNGVRAVHHARYDAHEEEWQLEWLLRHPR